MFVEGFIRAPAASEPILIGLPLSLFMLAAAVSMAFLGPLFDRLDRRHTFLIGSLLATTGLVGTGLAQSYYEVVLWRVVAGIGYGLNFVACQGYVFDRTTRAGRAGGISMFVGGIMTADICGPAIGGIMADRIGFSWTFLLGGAIALIAGALVYRLMEPPRTRLLPARRASLAAGLGAMSTNWRFWFLLLFAAVPAKVLLTGFLFYQAPLYLTALGSSQSEIGRFIMTYGIAALALTSFFGHWADRMQAHGLLIVAGGILAGLGMLPSLFGEKSGPGPARHRCARRRPGHEHSSLVRCRDPRRRARDRSCRPSFCARRLPSRSSASALRPAPSPWPLCWVLRATRRQWPSPESSRS